MEQMLLQQIRTELARANLLKCIELKIQCQNTGKIPNEKIKKIRDLEIAIDAIMAQL